jgi:hypothetical protein
MLHRRTLLATLPAALAAGPACATPPREVTVYKSASCGCCGGWVTAMSQAGFRPKVVTQDDISPVWRRHGVRDELSSCHAAEIGGYLTIGHVPPADVVRLLSERPRAVGLTVPGMPWGSPGMERPDGRREAYETLLLLPGGKTRVFAKHV